jgi:hypothetical protein
MRLQKVEGETPRSVAAWDVETREVMGSDMIILELKMSVGAVWLL